jgi:hypothetical protein
VIHKDNRIRINPVFYLLGGPTNFSSNSLNNLCLLDASFKKLAILLYRLIEILWFYEIKIVIRLNHKTVICLLFIP